MDNRKKDGKQVKMDERRDGELGSEERWIRGEDKKKKR